MTESTQIRTLQVVDSHTGGEPTRIIVSGGPDLVGKTVADKLADLKSNHDQFRRAAVLEPRGSDVIVGGILVEPTEPGCITGIIFFNNVGYLGMCGHGTIGLVATLAHLGKIGPGIHRIDTAVGVVTANLHDDGTVSIQNVPSYRYKQDIQVHVPGHGDIFGDVAWGGNWFFLVQDHGQILEVSNVELLTEFTWKIRLALSRTGITGANGAEIDHVELFCASGSGEADSRNFVLCPGKAYDRSPCGTGTSAKLACLYESGKLAEGEIWRQESIVGSIFSGYVEVIGDQIVPTIRGQAFVNGESNLILNEDDPFCWGIR